MMDQIKILKYSLYKKDSPKDQDPTTMLPDNKKALPLGGRNYTKIGGMWTLKHESSHNFFMNSSSIQNSNETLLWTSRTSTATSRCVSM